MRRIFSISNVSDTVLTTMMVVGLTPTAAAEIFPTKPIRLIVPFAAGGGTDILARDIAPRLAEAIGQTVIVENRGGAGGNIGTEAVARAQADGYTILFGSNTLAINAALYKNLPFDPQHSFEPIGLVASAPLVLVANASLPIASVKDLIEQAKAKPGTLNWSAPGNGTPHHLASELFNRMTDTAITHVQYKGGGPAINDLLGGHTQVSILTYSAIKPFIESGQLRALAVATPTRTTLMPTVPTIAESGVENYNADLWYGLFVPVGTPAKTIKILNTALNKALSPAEIVERFTAQGYELRQGPPSVLAKQLAADMKQVTSVVEEAGITVN